MSSNNQEVEIKFKVDNLADMKQKIISAGGQLVFHDIFQKTIRFDTAEESLQQRGTFIRVRSGEKNTMTLKKKLPGADKNYKKRLEIEIEISDIKKAIEILNHLGFTKEHIMEKYRTEYKLGEVILALDKLPFGDYLEIEGEKEKIENTISLLGLKGNKRLTVAYWYLFDDYNREHNVVSPNKNIVFEDSLLGSEAPK